ncbi:MAG: fucose 4-O-acetylase-like acetyltransferase [Candidatus Azotimanducaceae bacterium]|jgi:fucose 4-O-acetylase-like acetyltransferase
MNKMKHFSTVLLVFLVLSLALSAFAKITAIPQELEFYAQYGFDSLLLMAFGIQQVICIVLLLVRRSRALGAALSVLNFCVIIFLVAGTQMQLILGWLVPAALAGGYLCFLSLKEISNQRGVGQEI